MKKFLVFFLMLCLVLPVFCGIQPVSRTIGTVAVEIPAESDLEKVWHALQEEFTEDWLTKYAEGKEAFAVAYSPILSSLLPASGFLLSAEGDQITALFPQGNRKVVFLMKEGRVAALRAED